MGWIKGTCLLVASSRINMGEGFNTALARQKSCLSPWLSIFSGSKTADIPPSWRILSQSFSARSISSILLLRASFSSSCFSAAPSRRLCSIVPGTKNASCGRMFSRERSKFRGMLVISIPSMRIFPREISSSRKIVWISELFPLCSNCKRMFILRF